jgi:hypothetical protein
VGAEEGEEQEQQQWPRRRPSRHLWRERKIWSGFWRGTGYGEGAAAARRWC